MKTKNIGLIAFGIFFITLKAFCQADTTFTGINAEPDNSIQLHWASNTNEYYEIDYTTEFNTNSDGTTEWNTLYDNYPSQGTNTFWLDDGNGNTTPEIPSPKNTQMRFYRISVEGTNNGDDNLTVEITSLTNGAVLSGNVDVQVSASSQQILSAVTLYLDGKEMPRSLDQSNFVINTCQSWNGQHTLFATARSQSGMEGFRLDSPITYNRAVSPMVNISFENLITEFALSQDMFVPTNGVQDITATFAANCDWTLEILNDNSNAVRTVTGSGDALNYDWDGTGDGETNLPAGVYTYYLTASTNGEPLTVGGGQVETNPPPPSPDFDSDSSRLWAVGANDSVVPLEIYPPGFDTNGMTIFSATSAEVRSLQSDSTDSSSTSASSISGGIHFSPEDAGASGSSQSSSLGGAVGQQGTIGVDYQQYLNPNIYTHAPPSGFPYPLDQYVGIDGQSSTSYGFSVSVPKLLAEKQIADDFCNLMKTNGYFPTFENGNDSVVITDIEKPSLGGKSIFNTVNFGIFMGHGSYGSTAESDGVKYSYIWIENLRHYNLMDLRLSDMDLGGAEPNGLRWMTFLTCSALNTTDYNSMNSHSKLPINSNLHILLGASTTSYSAPDLGYNYAQYLLNNETIINAWNHAGTYTYSYQNGTNMISPVKFASSAWTSCIYDSLRSYEDPSSGDSLNYSQTQVY